MSALLNGRSQANVLPATDHVRPERPSPSITSGSSRAIVATSSSVGIAATYAVRTGRPTLCVTEQVPGDLFGDTEAAADTDGAGGHVGCGRVVGGGAVRRARVDRPAGGDVERVGEVRA